MFRYLNKKTFLIKFVNNYHIYLYHCDVIYLLGSGLVVKIVKF